MKPKKDPRPATLRERRRARGWTQARLCAEAGVSLSYYAVLETEPRLLRPAFAARLAAALGCNAADLLPASPSSPPAE
jgi:transcriptional regulator with XRE-family HTH domain